MHKTTLNERQQEAVEILEGPLLILAGAGAGKTKTLTHRMLELVKKGVAPHQILAVTFTNKAAKEMRERVEGLIASDPEVNLAGQEMSTPFVSTFHALGVYLLRHHSDTLGLKKHFPIFDRNDSVRAMKSAITEAGVDPKQFAPRAILGTISRQKGDAISRERYTESAGNNFYPRLVADIWARYDAILKKEGALDFDDLLAKAVSLLEHNPDLLKRYQERWRYIHVDEYQDTNAVQFRMAQLLSDTHRNICCVGDIDQNIYAWRGATIDNILAFEEQFPGAKVVLLEQNYRSTKTIVAVSNDIIEKNINRRKKTLFTENADGEPITLFVGYDESDEADYIARTMKTLIEGGTPAHEIAALYRANFQSRALEEACLTHDIPYQVLGVKFFERKEVKDILAFIRAALGRGSGDIARVVNVPARGIGKVTLTRMLANDETKMTPAVRKKVHDFYALLDRIEIAAAEKKPSELVRYVMSEAGIEAELRKGGDEEQERLENLKELVTLATKYDELPEDEALVKLLDDASLATDQDDLQETRSAVRLMTVHASKGLEFDTVFVTGLEEGLFPHEKLGETADEEEERRLFYVALTRARKKLYLTYASARTIFGSRQINIPSQFITDIDEIYLESEMGQEREGSRVIYLD